jgi:two-component system, cell cycle response regulator CpdR
MTARVLYVEDDDAVRRFLETLLAGEGYEVTAVDNAEAGIAALARQPGEFHVLLTDYELPHHNADWMLQLARDKGLIGTVPVLVLTGTGEPHGVEGHRVLRKPVDVEVLLAALQDVIAAPEEASVLEGPPMTGAPDVLKLTLYVTGGSRESQRALRNLQGILKKFERSRVSVTVHDVISHSDAGRLEDDRVVVTPTLVRTHPLPKAWAFGNLSQSELVEELIATGIADLASRG